MKDSTPTPIRVGTLVSHPKWGIAKVLEVLAGGNVVLYFRDLPEDKPGDSIKKISTAVVQLEIAVDQSDPLLDNLPPYEKGRFKGRVKPKPRLSIDEAVAAFFEEYPGGFSDQKYLSDGEGGERAYKWSAHELWLETLGEGRLRQLLDAGETKEAATRVLAVDGKINLLSKDEKMGLSDALDDAAAADAFLQALDAVVSEGEPNRAPFQLLIEAVNALPQREGGARVATWPVLTQFPYIALPEQHMLLKPTVVQNCAARLNFNLRHQPELNWVTYQKLLEMTAVLASRLEGRGARDNIDLQSFMCLIGRI